MIEILNFAAEGDDIKFVSDYIDHLNLQIGNKIETKTDGWGKLKFNRNKFAEVTDKNGKNIVIFDADGNHASRKADLDAVGIAQQMAFDLFLFPDNANPGAVEDLLLQIIHPQHHDYLACFDSYEVCLTQCQNPVTISRKSKLFAFLECSALPYKLSEINFRDPAYWDLDHDALLPLKGFLEAL